MSETDKTRPYDVQELDPLSKRIGSYPIFSGMSGKHGHAKQLHGLINTTRRQRERIACTVAMKMADPSELDLKPFWGDRRCVSYTLD